MSKTKAKTTKTPTERLRVHAAEMAKWLSPEHYYGLFYSALAKDGVAFDGYEPAANDPDAKEWKRRRRPKPKQCFTNAGSFVIDFKKAKYYEGLCVGGTPFPFDHAWVVYKGKVFDFTLEASGREKDVWYLGLPVPRRDLARSLLEAAGIPAGVLFYAKKEGKKKPAQKSGMS